METSSGLALNVWPHENPKNDTRSKESNSGPYDSDAEALPHTTQACKEGIKK